jgi:hypothetical protein
MEDMNFGDEAKDLETMEHGHFKEMYNKDTLVTRELIEEPIEQKLNQHTNDELTQDFTEEEIDNSLFIIKPL